MRGSCEQLHLCILPLHDWSMMQEWMDTVFSVGSQGPGTDTLSDSGVSGSGSPWEVAARAVDKLRLFDLKSGSNHPPLTSSSAAGQYFSLYSFLPHSSCDMLWRVLNVVVAVPESSFWIFSFLLSCVLLQKKCPASRVPWAGFLKAPCCPIHWEADQWSCATFVS